MPQVIFNGRRGVCLENNQARLTVLYEGGHIAEFFDKTTGISPLWIPPWDSLEPSLFDAQKHTDFGTGVDAKLLAGIMGHSLCLDIYGGPSVEEATAGLTLHGESSVALYEISEARDSVHMCATFPLAQLRFERRIKLSGLSISVSESVENLVALDRPIAWTQHVTLGPPFIERGVTQLRLTGSRSKVFEISFGADDYLSLGAEFDWPQAPLIGGGVEDLREISSRPVSSAFSTHLMDSSLETSSFTAFHPGYRLAITYAWQRRDFPWLGMWEENCSRKVAPWLGRTLTRGLEFGVSPMPESRREMVERNRMFDTPVYRWLPAKSRLEVNYSAMLSRAEAMRNIEQ